MTDHRRAVRVEPPPLQPPAAGAPAADQIPQYPPSSLLNAAIAPFERDGGAKKYAMLVGGWSGQSTDDCYEYDVTGRTWTRAAVRFPTPISDHTMVSMNNGAAILSFGGFDNRRLTNAMYVLTPSPAGEPMQWEQIKVTSDEKPAPRRQHAMTSITAADGSTYVYVFGGFDGTRRLNDLWVFDVQSSAWSEIDGRGTVPTPRDSAVLHGDAPRGRLVLFGGYTRTRTNDLFVFDIGQSTWTQVHATEATPSARFGACCACPDNNKDVLIIGLGQDNSGACKDTYQLNLADLVWAPQPFDGDEVEPRVHHASAMVDQGRRLLIAGGTSHQKDYVTMLELEFERVAESAAPGKKK